MTLTEARKFVQVRDAQIKLDSLRQAMSDTCKMFDKSDPEGSSKRIARRRAEIARAMSCAALEYAQLLEEFAEE